MVWQELNNLSHYKEVIGFTLIEVMVSLVIASITLSANILNLNAHLDLYHNLEKRYWSSRISWNELARNLYVGSNVTPGIKTSGKVNLEQEWYWRIEAQDFSLAGMPVKKLDLKVSADADFNYIYSTLSGLTVK